MTERTIQSIIHADKIDMGGMPVRQAFPSAKVVAPDPFLLLHHADIKVPTHLPVHQAGVGPHPHRGFSPVTFVFKGGVHHRDSRGNNQVVYEGGTQWMNAGLGVIHSERPPADIFERGGRQEIIQLWVNTPAAHKMDIPTYYPLTANETPFIMSEDGLVKINIHSGALDGVHGVIPTFSEVNTFTANFQTSGIYRFIIPANHNVFVYVLHGKVLVANNEVEANYVSILHNDGDGFTIKATEASELMIGTGVPLDEPIVSHGPFVMNSQTEILQAFADYQKGKMGILIED